MTISPMLKADCESNFEALIKQAQISGIGEIHVRTCQQTGMVAIIAIHSTKLGPALGGCRFIKYPSVGNAVKDAIRLAQGMSYKAAMAKLPLGGGKAVIIEPSGNYDRAAYLESFAKFVEDLGGRYITAIDCGTSIDDMDLVNQTTNYVASVSNSFSEPSEFTAMGVLKGILAATQSKGYTSLNKLRIVIQGVGKVGLKLANLLYKEGASLTIADTNKENCQFAAQNYGASIVSPEECITLPCDILSPCALGGVITKNNIDKIQTKIIAGAANNQLENMHCAELLNTKGITYIPDYVINAGGLIFAAGQYLGIEHETTQNQLENIYVTTTAIVQEAKRKKLPPLIVANEIAKARLA